MHPAVIAVLVVDLLGAAAIGLAMVQSTRVAVGWDASSASSAQLRLERLAEEGAAAGRLGAVLHGIAGLGLLILINHLLPAIVPGAMCGIGVMQALPDGWAAVAMRALSLIALCAWCAADRLNRGVPTGPLAQQSSRMMLVAGAAALIASWRTLSSLVSLDLHKAVSCCAAVYDLGTRGVNGGSSLLEAGWSHAAVLVAIGLGLAAGAVLTRRPRPAWVHLLMGVAALGFAVLGAWLVVDMTAPVVYGTLGHRCPLCLFLPRHGGFGYLAFGAIAWLVFEAASAVAVVMVSRSSSEARALADRASRTSWIRAAIAAAVVVMISLGPQLLWRLRFGVQIGG